MTVPWSTLSSRSIFELFPQDWDYRGRDMYVIITRWKFRCWIYIKSECLNCFTQGIHAPKNSCFDTWLCKHQSPRSFYNTSLGIILNSKSCVWSFIALGGVDMWMFGLLATSSGINFHGHFDYFSFSFCILHHQNIPLKCNYVYQMSLEYLSIFLGGEGQQIIIDAVVSLVCMIASNSKRLA